ncbi:MAG TPA: hypothetical protein VND43_05385 [Burkholderiales bacterium]|nr:hypothetical protein [Pseudomonadota bacterium]HVC49579.1 hypothetical protein [Burkholderiales bacterium]
MNIQEIGATPIPIPVSARGRQDFIRRQTSQTGDTHPVPGEKKKNSTSESEDSERMLGRYIDIYI